MGALIFEKSTAPEALFVHLCYIKYVICVLGMCITILRIVFFLHHLHLVHQNKLPTFNINALKKNETKIATAKRDVWLVSAWNHMVLFVLGTSSQQHVTKKWLFNVISTWCTKTKCLHLRFVHWKRLKLKWWPPRDWWSNHATVCIVCVASCHVVAIMPSRPQLIVDVILIWCTKTNFPHQTCRH